MGKEQTKEMQFWTTEEYKKFSDAIMDLPENQSSTMEIWKVREQARMDAEESIFTDIIYRLR